MDIRVAALTEALLSARKLHLLLAVFNVAGVAALDLLVRAREGELGHTVVVKAILAGGDRQPAAGGVATGAGAVAEHRVRAPGVGALVTGFAGFRRQFGEHVMPVDIAVLRQPLASLFGFGHRLVLGGVAVEARDAPVFAIDGEIGLGAVVEPLVGLKLELGVTGFAVAQEP